MDLLKALEDEGIDTEFVTGASTPAVLDGEQAPAEPPRAELSDADKAQIFLFMLRKHVGPAEFAKLIDSNANDLEVYGMIDNAKQAQINNRAMNERSMKDRGKDGKALMMAAIKLAIAEGFGPAKEFVELEKKERDLIAQIMEKYEGPAREAVSTMLADYGRKAMSMSGPVARYIQGTIYDMNK